MAQPLKLVASLRCNIKHGIRAPHKPVLMLAVVHGFENGFLQGNQVFISPELISAFKQIWNLLVTTDHDPNMALPFYHLGGEPFWKLVPKPEISASIVMERKSRQLSTLDSVIAYARIEAEMAEWFNSPEKRAAISQTILHKYFPDTLHNFHINAQVPDLLRGLNDILLNTPRIVYKSEIKELLAAKDDEAIYLRSASFKRLVPMIYDFGCAASHWRLTSSSDVSMIDACHIVPFSESYDDTITNGIALAPTMHRAFDRGLISISDDYLVLIANNFNEEGLDWSIRRLRGKQILLPKNTNHWPGKENLRWHREQFGFK